MTTWTLAAMVPLALLTATALAADDLDDPDNEVPIQGPSAGLEVGAGLRSALDPFDDPATVFDGVRLIARYPLGEKGVHVEGDLYVRTASKPWSDPAVDAAEVVRGSGDPDSGFMLPVSRDRFAVACLVDWSFGRRDGGALLAGGPRLLGGAGVRRFEQHWATVNDLLAIYDPLRNYELQPGQKSTALLLLGGVALDAWYVDRLGVRATLITNVRYAERPDYDPSGDTPNGHTVMLDPYFSIDFLVRL